MSTIPDSVPTSRERDLLAARIGQHGLVCTDCDEPASDTQTELFLAYIASEPEPAPYVCLACTWCDDCGRAGHEAGTGDCPWEVA